MPDLSTDERLTLVKHINALLQPDFETLLFALNVQNGVIPSGQAAQGNRAIALLQWVESPSGCGMSKLLKTLDAMATLPFDFGIQGKTTQESSKKNFQESLPNGVLLDMVYIPNGQFYMGSPENEEERENWEGPQHRVNVPAFYIGKYSVTQAQWYEVARLGDIDRVLKTNPSWFKGDDLPVEQVSWNHAIEFCKRLSKYTGKYYRLPSEAEWEYACRAYTTTPFHFGETISPDQANYDRTYPSNNGGNWTYRLKTTPVGSFQPNAFGLFDMHGNVQEWCQDLWHDSYEGAPTDGSAWDVGDRRHARVLRGGSWHYIPSRSRSASRYDFTLDYCCNDIGFRVVCGVPRV